MSLQILIVERDPHARQGLRAILSSEGHAVSLAGDMWDGFARISSQAFDLLLLDDDVRPEQHATLSVLDLLRFARSYHATAAGTTAGIVLSSFEEDAPRYRAEPGVLAVLQKPVEVRRLQLCLDALDAPARAELRRLKHTGS